MQRLALTRAGIALPIVTFLARGGAQVERLLERSGIPPWALADPEAMIPTASVARLLVEAGRSEGIERLGLLAGESARFETLGLYGRLARGAPTLGDALRMVVENHRTFSSNGRMWLVSRGQRTELHQAFLNRFDEGWQQASHYILMLMLGIVRLGAGRTWRPAEVSLQTGPFAGLRDIEALSAAKVSFDQPSTMIALPTALLAARLRPPEAGVAVPPQGIDTWRASAPADDFVEAVTQVIDTLSWDRYPDVRLTADVLGMSVRSLQRHLAAAGLNHESLIGRVRFSTAAALLEETDARILDIALDVGYSDQAHFTRAFKRWAGCSPQEHRRRHRRGDGPEPRRP